MVKFTATATTALSIGSDADSSANATLEVDGGGPGQGLGGSAGINTVGTFNSGGNGGNGGKGSAAANGGTITLTAAGTSQNNSMDHSKLSQHICIGAASRSQITSITEVMVILAPVATVGQLTRPLAKAVP